MPSELRILRFKLDEVSVAVKSFSSRIKMAVPATMILEAHVAPDGSPNILLRYEGEEKVVAITNNRLAASLIAYCQIINVPLPRKASKSLNVFKEYMDMRIVMPTLGSMSVSAVMREIELESETGTKPDTVIEIES